MGQWDTMMSGTKVGSPDILGKTENEWTSKICITEKTRQASETSVPVRSFQSGWDYELEWALEYWRSTQPKLQAGGRIHHQEGYGKGRGSVLVGAGKGTIDVRLHGIDAPERDQEYHVSCPHEA